MVKQNRVRKGITGMATNKSARPKTQRKAVSVPKVAVQSWLRMKAEEELVDSRPLWNAIRNPERGWTPTAMGNPCDRQTILGVLGYRGDPISPGLYKIFKRGNTIEAEWQAYFREWGMLLDHNVRIKSGPNSLISVSGEYDVRLRHPYEPSRQFIVEIKSINDRGFGCLPAVSLDPEVNFEHLYDHITDSGIKARVRKYLIQLMTYLYETQTYEGILLFDNKNTQNYADFYLTLNEEFVLEEYTKLDRLNGYWQQLIVPPCSCLTDNDKGTLCKVHADQEIDLESLKALTSEEF